MEIFLVKRSKKKKNGFVHWLNTSLIFELDVVNLEHQNGKKYIDREAAYVVFFFWVFFVVFFCGPLIALYIFWCNLLFFKDLGPHL